MSHFNRDIIDRRCLSDTTEIWLRSNSPTTLLSLLHVDGAQVDSVTGLWHRTNLFLILVVFQELVCLDIGLSCRIGQESWRTSCRESLVVGGRGSSLIICHLYE